jgi:hypothetical protein
VFSVDLYKKFIFSRKEKIDESAYSQWDVGTPVAFVVFTGCPRK